MNLPKIEMLIFHFWEKLVEQQCVIGIKPIAAFQNRQLNFKLGTEVICYMLGICHQYDLML